MSFDVKRNNPKKTETKEKAEPQNTFHLVQLHVNIKKLETEVQLYSDIINSIIEGNFAWLNFIDNNLHSFKIDLPTGMEKQLLIGFIEQLISFKNKKIEILNIVYENA